MGKLSINLDDYDSKLGHLYGLIEKMTNIDWTTENAIQFCNNQGLQIKDLSLHHNINMQNLLTDFNNFDYESLKNKILVSRNQITELFSVKFDDYNESYQNYINSILSKKNDALNNFFDIPFNIKKYEDYLIHIISKLSLIITEFNFEADELFEHFKYGNKNYVIFGKNGSGKTTLLKKISASMFKNAIVIPANRKVNQPSSNYISYNVNYNLNQMLQDEISLMYLTRELNSRTLDLYENKVEDSKIIRSRFYEIFSSLGLERDVIAEKECLFLKGEQIGK